MDIKKLNWVSGVQCYKLTEINLSSLIKAIINCVRWRCIDWTTAWVTAALSSGLHSEESRREGLRQRPPCSSISLAALTQLTQSYTWWRRPVDGGLKSGMLFNDKKAALRAERFCLITCLLFVRGNYIDTAALLPHHPHVSLSPSVRSHRQAADSYFHPPLKHFVFP